MKCANCKNEIASGENFCGFCGMENIDVNEKSSILEELKMKGESNDNGMVLKIKNMEEQTNEVTDKKSPFEKFFILIFLAVFIVIPIGWSIWYDATKPPDIPRCKETQKKKQVITKLDGGTTSVTTETVNGCEFIEYPN